MGACGQTCRRASVAALLIVVFSVILAGCGGVAVREALDQSERLPGQAAVAAVPFYPQEELQCGPAALAMVLSWSGLPVQPGDLAGEVYTPHRQGSLQSALVASARRHSRIAYPINGPEELFAEVAAGRPVIVLLNLAFSWYPRYHYAVVIGYDRPAETVILHSGTRSGERLSFRVFDNIWARSEYWGLLVLPPDQMPVAPDEKAWLAAVVGLERAEQWQAAAVAYQAAAGRWPRSALSRIGLGNSRYALDDSAGAIEAFREAVRLDPASAIAYNNLAQVLAETGRIDEGLAAARRAVELGGPHQDACRRTLAELLEQHSGPRPGPTR
ncbi:MAG: PA2778 family cysteine peptidase [Desulfobulbaceae bacterium]